MHRNYLPGRNPGAPIDRNVTELANDIDRPLGAARHTIDANPGRDRVAVLAALKLFASLNAEIRDAGAAGVMSERVH